jgi:hypothetical protein
LGVVLLLLAGTTALRAEPRPLEFRVTFTKAVSSKPFTGRVYVMLTKGERKEPPSDVNWFATEPLFARDVKDWKPGEELTIGADALGYPHKLPKLPKATYSIFAVMDFDRGDRLFSAAEGNGWSKPVRRELIADESGPISLTIDQVFKSSNSLEGDQVKLVDIESKLLTAFHGRAVRLRAAVSLPASWARDKDKKYPVIYEIPGFGGNHLSILYTASRRPREFDGVEMLYVMLDPSCRNGHHVFADSANNGPYGKALIEELIPHIEQRFRGINAAGARFVTGHSSGGWSSLWLQVTYPDHFGGVWSTAPDPVDFRDFQRIDLTQKDANMFTGPDGKPRPIARRGDRPGPLYKDFSDMEVVTGHGGQLASFEAVFSPRGADGKPRPLWDRVTGAVDPETARSWERYDIRLTLEKNWKTLGPKLAGKIHVYMGEMDTFYLEGATRLLQKSLKDLGSDAVVELFPGRNHGSLMDAKLRARIAKEMADAYRRYHDKTR